MSGDFLDTNVLVYALGAGPKARPARTLLAGAPCISVQVLNELVNIGRKKSRWSWEEIKLNLTQVQLAASRIVDVTLAVHVLGLHLAERYGLSIYDAMIAAAALDAGCTTLWSEDMHHGMVLAGQLTIRNPFV
jgi:predicted nucleic acid-binding protein